MRNYAFPCFRFVAATLLLFLSSPTQAVRGQVAEQTTFMGHPLYWTSLEMVFDTLDGFGKGSFTELVEVEPMALAVLNRDGAQLQALTQLSTYSDGQVAMGTRRGDQDFSTRNLATDLYWVAIDSV